MGTDLDLLSRFQFDGKVAVVTEASAGIGERMQRSDIDVLVNNAGSSNITPLGRAGQVDEVACAADSSVAADYITTPQDQGGVGRSALVLRSSTAPGRGGLGIGGATVGTEASEDDVHVQQLEAVLLAAWQC